MPNDANQTPKLTQNKFLQALKGKEILVVFLDGKAAQGVLKAYDQYTLFLRRDDGLEVAVFKHAVKYVHAVRRK